MFDSLHHLFDSSCEVAIYKTKRSVSDFKGSHHTSFISDYTAYTTSNMLAFDIRDKFHYIFLHEYQKYHLFMILETEKVITYHIGVLLRSTKFFASTTSFSFCFQTLFLHSWSPIATT